MPLWGDDDSTNASVFDWGSTNGTSGNRGASASTDEGPSSNGAGNGHKSRYDPNTMNRINDITDLVDDSSDSDDDTIVGHASSTRTIKHKNTNKTQQHTNGPSVFRLAVILVSLMAIIAAAGFGLLLAITENKKSSNSNATGGGGEEARALEQQELLEVAESVVTACSEEQLDIDMGPCQTICHASLCCFEEEEYSCEDDEDKECAVYGGCEALVYALDHVVEEEDEEEDDEEKVDEEKDDEEEVDEDEENEEGDDEKEENEEGDDEEEEDEEEDEEE